MGANGLVNSRSQSRESMHRYNLKTKIEPPCLSRVAYASLYNCASLCQCSQHFTFFWRGFLHFLFSPLLYISSHITITHICLFSLAQSNLTFKKIIWLVLLLLVAKIRSENWDFLFLEWVFFFFFHFLGKV